MERARDEEAEEDEGGQEGEKQLEGKRGQSLVDWTYSPCVCVFEDREGRDDLRFSVGQERRRRETTKSNGMNVVAVLEAAEAEEKHRIELCGMETKRRRSKVVARGGFWQRGEKRKGGSVVKGIRFRSDGEVVSRKRERERKRARGTRRGMSRESAVPVGFDWVVGERKREFGAVDRASNSKGSRRLAVRQDADARRC